MSTAQSSDAPPTENPAFTAQLFASLDSIADAFLLLDGEMRFIYVNTPAEAVLQRSRADLIGKNMWTEFPEGRGTVAEAEYARVMREGGATKFELDFPPLGMRLEVRAFSSHGGLAIMVRNITEDHQLQERMRMLQAAVARLQDIVVITGAALANEPDPKVVFVNEAFERVTGYSAAEAIGLPPQFLRGPNTDVAEIERMRAELRAGQAVQGEIAYYTKAGEELWVDIQMSPFRSPTGEATHIVIVAREINERRRAREALQESIERFRIVARATADVVWDWNLAEDTIWWGDGMRTLFGYAYDDTPRSGESWVRHIHPDDAERVVRDIRAVIDGDAGESKWADEYRFIRADGSCAQVSDRGFVIRDASGKALRMVGAMMDVTEQRALEAQLRQSQRLEAVGQLTGGVAHDFNNLLTVILSNAELLETRLADDHQLHLLAEMTRIAAERGAELTSRLLSFSRRQALDPKPTDVNALLRGMEGLMRRALGEHIDVRIEAGEEIFPALIDTLQLESAILNLGINARDAMPGGGRLTLETANAPPEGDGEFVVITVSDTGTGMDEATRARAFEPFFTTKEVGKGSGLGLSMVYGFVTQSKGRIELDTAPGEGTSVKLYLPRAGEALRDARAGVAAEALQGDERILLVEDDDLVRAQVSAELAMMGYRVVSVRDGAEALAALAESRAFDLLFTDVVMPGGMNGRQLAEAVRAIVPSMAVLYTSGHPEHVLEDEGRLAPGVTLLRKPYRRRELAAKLREVLGEGASRRREA